MEKTYDPQAIEQRWYRAWEERGWFAPAGDGPPYCIMIPPPNVTGTLHMGHAFQDTIMDALIRYHRMKGDRTLWQAGTDHAGIATQMVVERRLEAEGKTRHDLGREAFVQRIWQWREHSGGTITRQLRRMGASLDWSRERFTMDEGLSAAVAEVFVRLFEKGLIYRGKRLVNWDPVLHTAVSDLEVLSQEEQGQLWHMRYPLTNGSGHLTVATTRPETMLGDAAVAVHPGDERYVHLIGELVELPLTGRRIPVIADEYVDPEFGTGCVKITPAHDFNDYQVWLRHRDMTVLSDQPHGGLINIFTPDAAVRENGAEEDGLIPQAYVDLDRYQARTRIVEDLRAQGLLERIDDHRLMVPRGDRSGAVIEPFLTDQWYVRVEPLARAAIEAVERGHIRFVPDNWKNTYFEWMRNIEDWCISRQIWWGHRIPAWYDAEGNVYVGRSEREVRATHGLADDYPLRRDEDVLDTWFSSALWPFSTLGWPERTRALATFYPTAVLVTGFDIIFFWVARMIMMGLEFMGDVPFREVYVTGLIRDEHGDKMSKSKGNVLDPVDMIDGIAVEDLVAKRTSGMMQPRLAERIAAATRASFPQGIAPHGADALRFTLAALASTGRDINWDMKRLEGYRNFCNKLWNAARYVLMNTEGQDCGQGGEEVELGVPERWIQARLDQTAAAVTESLEAYRFDQAAQALYEFTWNEYCDWYLELSKTVLQDESAPAHRRRGTRRTLVRVLEALLRLMHPIMPFITEELWQRVAPLAGRDGETVMLQPWPEAGTPDLQAVAQIDWVKAFVLGIRRIRAEMDIAPQRPLQVMLQGGHSIDRERVARHEGIVSALARIDALSWMQDDATVPESATALVGELKLLIPLAGLIDKEAELKRLRREIERLSKDLARARAKLENPSFLERAPGEVVEKERRRVAELSSALEKLEEQAARVEAL